MDCSMSGLPIPHHLPKFVQVHVHCISNDIQLSNPLTHPSASALNLSQHQGLFQWVNCLHQVTKILVLQHQSFQWIFRVDFPLRLTGLISLLSKGLSGVFTSTNSLVLCLLYSPAFTSICDQWEDHGLDCMDLCWQSNVSAFQHTV